MPRNPKSNQPNVTDILEVELQDKISRCSMIIDTLTGNPAWMAICEDYEQSKVGLDQAWAFVTDAAQMYKLQINKLGILSILNLIDTYKQERERLVKELNILQNPDKVLEKDFDTEV